MLGQQSADLHSVLLSYVAADLVPWRTKMRVFGKLPSFTKVKALGELVHLRNPEKLIASAVVNPEVMGPKILYALLLDHVSQSLLQIYLRCMSSY